MAARPKRATRAGGGERHRSRPRKPGSRFTRGNPRVGAHARMLELESKARHGGPLTPAESHELRLVYDALKVPFLHRVGTGSGRDKRMLEWEVARTGRMNPGGEIPLQGDTFAPMGKIAVGSVVNLIRQHDAAEFYVKVKDITRFNEDVVGPINNRQYERTLEIWTTGVKAGKSGRRWASAGYDVVLEGAQGYSYGEKLAARSVSMDNPAQGNNPSSSDYDEAVRELKAARVELYRHRGELHNRDERAMPPEWHVRTKQLYEAARAAERRVARANKPIVDEILAEGRREMNMENPQRYRLAVASTGSSFPDYYDYDNVRDLEDQFRKSQGPLSRYVDAYALVGSGRSADYRHLGHWGYGQPEVELREANPAGDYEDWLSCGTPIMLSGSPDGTFTEELPSYLGRFFHLRRHDDGDLTASIRDADQATIGAEVVVPEDQIADVYHYALHHQNLIGWMPNSEGYSPDQADEIDIEGEFEEVRVENPVDEGKFIARLAESIRGGSSHPAKVRAWIRRSQVGLDQRVADYGGDDQASEKLRTNIRLWKASLERARGGKANNPASGVVAEIARQLVASGISRTSVAFVAWDENTLKVSKNLRGALIKYNRGTDLYDVTPYDASGMGARSPFMSKHGTRDQGAGVEWDEVIEGVGVEQLREVVEPLLGGRQGNPGRYELFYNDGGHGGPYISLDQAIRRAKQIIAGSRSTTAIEVRPYSATGTGGYGPAVVRVTPDGVQALTPQMDRLLHGAGVVDRTPAGLRSEYSRRNPLVAALGRANVVTLPDRKSAKDYLRGLPPGYNGRVFQTEHGGWAVSYRYKEAGDMRRNPDSDLPKCYELGRRLGAAGGVGHKMQQGPRLEQFARRRIKDEGLRPPLMSDGVRSFIRGYEDRLREPHGRQSNPADGAAALYEDFHGVPSEEEVVVTEEVRYHGNLAGLGTLVEIVVKTPSGYKAVLDFNGSETLLCSSEDGKQLYLRGGDQSIDLDAIKMNGDEWLRDSMVLGVVQKMTYRTAKKFDDLKVLDYEHKLGEESGVHPELIYDVLNNQLSVAGGQYDVRPEGVVN